jgi:hypothetical protein
MSLDEMYENIDLEKIPQFAKLAGVSFNGRQSSIKFLQSDMKLDLIRDYKNQYDKNAIGAYIESRLIGWIPKYLAEKLAPEIDAGISWHAVIKEITGRDKDTQGVNIELICSDN